MAVKSIMRVKYICSVSSRRNFHTFIRRAKDFLQASTHLHAFVPYRGLESIIVRFFPLITDWWQLEKIAKAYKLPFSRITQEQPDESHEPVSRRKAVHFVLSFVQCTPGVRISIVSTIFQFLHLTTRGANSPVFRKVLYPAWKLMI